jgi:hypothetical protein
MWRNIGVTLPVAMHAASSGRMAGICNAAMDDPHGRLDAHGRPERNDIVRMEVSMVNGGTGEGY